MNVHQVYTTHTLTLSIFLIFFFLSVLCTPFCLYHRQPQRQLRGHRERAGVECPSCMYAMPRDDYDSDYYDYDYDYYDYCPEEVSRCRHRDVGPRFVHVTAIGPIYVENTLNADIIIGDKSSQKPTIQRSIIVLTSKLAAILVQCVIYTYTCMYLYNTHIHTYIYIRKYIRKFDILFIFFFFLNVIIGKF